MASEPPPLPPPIPVQAPDDGSTGTPRPTLEGKLHPLTLLFAVWNTIRGIIIPLIIIVLFGRKRAEDLYLLLAMIFMVLPIGLAVIRYFTFSYRIQNGELIT